MRVCVLTLKRQVASSALFPNMKWRKRSANYLIRRLADGRQSLVRSLTLNPVIHELNFAVNNVRDMRILHVLGQRPDGTGSSTVVRNLFREQRIRGDDPFVLHAAYGPDDFSGLFGDHHASVVFGISNSGDVPGLIPGMSDVMPYPTRRYSDLSRDDVEQFVYAFGRKLDRCINHFSPDVVHLNHLWVLLSLFVSRRQSPLVVTVHGTDLQQASLAPAFRSYVSDALAEPRHFIAVSSGVSQAASAMYSIDSHRMTVVPNGFDERVFYPARRPVARSPKIVLAVGKFVSWKRLDLVVRAFAECDHRDSMLVIVGSGSEESKESLAKLAREKGIAPSAFVMPGHQPPEKVAEWMRRATVLVHAGFEEAFGLVMLEALACGCPVIATNTSGAQEIFTNELSHSGWATIVEKPNGPIAIDAYVTALAEVINSKLGSAQLNDFGELKPILSRFTWSSINSRVRAIYKRACDQDRSALPE